MLSSIAEALGINGTFFVQFFIFMAFYPVLSRLLFRPYFQLEQKREQETSLRVQKAEALKAKKADLEAEYQEKARLLNKEFNQLYQQESQQIKQKFLKSQEVKQAELKKEYDQKHKDLAEEIKQARQEGISAIDELSKSAFDHLLSR